MKIVLLPGLDGTGNLFSSLLHFLPAEEVTVIALPDFRKQTYDALADYCQDRMPNEPYILVAEPFSGPIGIKLAAKDSGLMKRLVLVATFASPPKPIISKICSFLLIKSLIRLPLSGFVSRLLFLGFSTPREILESFLNAIASVPSQVIVQRLRVASSFECGISFVSVQQSIFSPQTMFLFLKSVLALLRS